jgi:periplasmic divalent cation tolerance protein
VYKRNARIPELRHATKGLKLEKKKMPRKHEIPSKRFRVFAFSRLIQVWYVRGALRMAEVVLILTTVPDASAGETIARALVDERLAACVNVLPAMTSIYRWQGAVERATEHQIVIKTTRSRAAAVQARMRELHTYDLPEFLVLDVADGSPGYFAWIRGETGIED